MNVSQINLQQDTSTSNIYATINDAVANKNALISDGPRNKHLLLSSSNELELILTKQNEATENRFMLHLKGKIIKTI